MSSKRIDSDAGVSRVADNTTRHVCGGTPERPHARRNVALVEGTENGQVREGICTGCGVKYVSIKTTK